MTLTEHFANLDAEDELRDAISSAIWHAAYRTLGMQDMALCGHLCCVGRPPFDTERWTAERADDEAQRRVHLEAVRLAVAVGQDPRPWVSNARDKGATWEQVGAVLGISRQSAHERFARRQIHPSFS